MTTGFEKYEDETLLSLARGFDKTLLGTIEAVVDGADPTTKETNGAAYLAQGVLRGLIETLATRGITFESKGLALADEFKEEG